MGSSRSLVGELCTEQRYVHEGPTGSWAGAVSPAEEYYEQRARERAAMERQLNPQRAQRIGTVAELGVQLVVEAERELQPVGAGR